MRASKATTNLRLNEYSDKVHPVQSDPTAGCHQLEAAKTVRLQRTMRSSVGWRHNRRDVVASLGGRLYHYKLW